MVIRKPRLAVVGLGYVGLANLAYFIVHGHKGIIAFDTNSDKILRLKDSTYPLDEYLLAETLRKKKNSVFYTDSPAELKSANVFFLAVGTPESEDGSADLSAIFSSVSLIADNAKEDSVIVIRSTVPVGTAKELKRRLSGLKFRFSIVSFPEFLSEGTSFDDECSPARIVIGADNNDDFLLLEALKSSEKVSGIPFYEMSNESAELTKYASNAFLATKISFINSLTPFAEKTGADITSVALAMGADPRIGYSMLKAGVGYGGGCFPKDVASLAKQGEDEGIELQYPILSAKENHAQVVRFINKIKMHMGDLRGKSLSLLGLSYKENISDIRGSLSIAVAKELLSLGAKVKCYDSKEGARIDFQKAVPASFGCSSLEKAVERADAIIILTSSQEFRELDETKLAVSMRGHIVFDGRNIYALNHFKILDYVSIGRNDVINSK